VADEIVKGEHVARSAQFLVELNDLGRRRDSLENFDDDAVGWE
jgi:hypothetical protein